MTDYIQVGTTTGSEDEAKRIGRALIERRLAACVQTMGPIESVYWWKEVIETATEWQCVAKTKKNLFDASLKTINEFHSYDVPEILVVPVTDGFKPYLAWIDDQLR